MVDMTAATSAVDRSGRTSGRRIGRTTWRRLAATVALAGALAGCSSARAAQPEHRVPAVPAPQPGAAAANPFVTTTVVEPPVAPAASPDEAVRRYVAAEADGDGAASYALLADADRTRVGSLAAWLDEAGERLPLRSLTSVQLDGSTVVTEATLEARLDEGGFVPARARIEWRPVRSGGGWLVSPTATQVVALLPPDADATGVVATWLQARQRSETVGQYVGSLLGQPTLVDAVPAGSVRVGAVGRLDTAPDPQVAVNAFGPEATRFVRAVPVQGPVPLVVLVAPFEATWQVVGVEAPR